MHAASTVTPLFPTTTATPRSWLAASTTPPVVSALLSTASSSAPSVASAVELDDVEVQTPTIVPAAASPVAVERPHPVHALLQAALDGLSETQTELVDRARTEIVELALHVARHIVGEQIAWGAVDLQPLVDDALARLAGALDVVVRVGPAHHAAIASALSERSGVRVALEADFGAADLVVDSDAGSVDARLESRLGGVEKAIRDSVGGSAGGGR